MAFDGITISCIVKELQDELTGGRLYKIAQPENDELLITIKNNGGQKRLMLSADASLPLAYLTSQNKPSPMTAPNFCMLLRKHLQNARIVKISQPGLERVIQFDLEHLDEMGDLCTKTLLIELMGKHSNIIFLNSEHIIIDSIKHISGMISSVREVLPGRNYFIPETTDKADPLTVERDDFIHRLTSKAMPLYKALYTGFTGLSPVIAQEICVMGNIDADYPSQILNSDEQERIWNAFLSVLSHVKNKDYNPVVIYDNNEPLEYNSFPLKLYEDKEVKEVASISMLLENYYAEKSKLTRIRQRSVDLRKIVTTMLERNIKKYDLQMKQLQDASKKEKYKVYGELITAYGYQVEQGSKSFEALNYYTNEMITIPLDPDIKPIDNAKKYFDKYSKMKRTEEALQKFSAETRNEIIHLESIATALDIAQAEEDLVQIKEEMMLAGYIHRKVGNKKMKITSKPFHYVSSDGFDMYVGKNNLQNDELTFHFAVGNDWWFHAKGRPGSHVVVKTNGKDLPDTTFEEAARLAAFYSKAKKGDKVEIDYLEKKNVKKPNGSKPGFVVYYTNYSMVMDADITGIKLISS